MSKTLENIRVIVSDANGQMVWQSSPIIPTSTKPNPIVVPVEATGQFVRLQKTGTLDTQCRVTFQFDDLVEYESCYHPLEIAEVEVIKSTPATTNSTNNTVTNTGSGTSSGTGTADPGPSINTSTSNTSTVTNSSSLVYSTLIGSGLNITNARITATLLRNGIPVPFLSIFSPFNVLWGVNGKTMEGKQITSYTDASIAWTTIPTGPASYFRIDLSGTKNPNAEKGTYSIEIRIEDNSGATTKTQTSNFVVQ